MTGRRTWTTKFASALIREKLAEAQAAGKYKAIIIDGFPLTSGSHTEELVQEFRASYSGLTIVIESPRNLAKKRYLERFRLVTDNEERFEKRMTITVEVLPTFAAQMAKLGSVVYSMNDHETIEEAYDVLKSHLIKDATFQELVQRDAKVV
jgi:adenylate kinase family enzyme